MVPIVLLLLVKVLQLMLVTPEPYVSTNLKQIWVTCRRVNQLSIPQCKVLMLGDTVAV